MNRSSLVIRLAVVVVFTAGLVGFITDQIFYRITFLNEQKLNLQYIEQLHNTVSATASIATYLEDEELIREVINGLVSNDVIASASISTNKLLIKSDDFDSQANLIIFDLYSPFEKTRKVGTLSVEPNINIIEQKAEKIGLDNTIALSIEATIITIMMIIIAYFVVTSPLLQITKALHTIIPGSSDRIKIPKQHQESELGTLVYDINNLLDKTEQQIESERGLRAEVELLEKRFRMLFENSTAPIVLMEPQGSIVLYNEAFSLLLKRLNQPLKRNFGPYLKQLFIQPKKLEIVVTDAFAIDETATGEFQLISENNDPVWVQAVVTSTITTDFKEYYQVTMHDISKRKQQIEQLDRKANYDQLTQLFNRHAAERQITTMIEQKQAFGLILLDLNGFKPINDIYGHDAGDEILIHVTAQLTKALRKHDLLSRWGGDEFVIILPNVSQFDVEKICIKLNDKIAKPHFLNQHQKSVSVSASMGVAFYPEDKETLQELVKSADLAMYEAKKFKTINSEHYLSFFDKSKSRSEH